MFGRAGKNKIIRVPCGVVVKRVLDHDEVWDPLCHTVRKIGAANPAENLSEYQVSDENDGIDPFEDDDDNEEEDEEDYDSIPPGQLSIICEGSGRKAFDEADLIFDEIDEQTYEERERIVLADLDKPGSWCLVARGGRGGRGNCDFAKVHGPLPDPEFLLERAKAQAGEIAYLELELKLIADLGLVGKLIAV
jgi:GTPase involved in cell partitioning and DNA repair